MCGSRNKVGATIMPATAPIAPAKPHPSISMRLTGTPSSRAESAFSAAARMARPNGVSLRNANSTATIASVTAMAPS
ncbi:hypothetical protein D9M72_578800 [compost metagenome]